MLAAPGKPTYVQPSLGKPLVGRAVPGICSLGSGFGPSVPRGTVNRDEQICQSRCMGHLRVRGTDACRREQVSVPRGRNISSKLYRPIGALLFFLTLTLSLVGQSARGLTLGTVALHGSATVTRTQTTHTTRRIISTKLRGKSSWSMGEHLLLGGAITWMSACSA